MPLPTIISLATQVFSSAHKPPVQKPRRGRPKTVVSHHRHAAIHMQRSARDIARFL